FVRERHSRFIIAQHFPRRRLAVARTDRNPTIVAVAQPSDVVQLEARRFLVVVDVPEPVLSTQLAVIDSRLPPEERCPARIETRRLVVGPLIVAAARALLRENRQRIALNKAEAEIRARIVLPTAPANAVISQTRERISIEHACQQPAVWQRAIDGCKHQVG